ncbi:MAG: LamG domain-containing protein [Chitinophagaceae bacterium]|nr:MAG: LamG domain-containing protein [Chitinophagaceae bacterium]
MKLKQNISWLLLVAGISVTMIACEKDMDEYAPERPIGGYSSSSEIASENLVAHWAFENVLTDSVSNISATATGTAFAAGRKGQGFKGAADGYALVDAPGTRLPAMQSFTIAFWMNTAQPDGKAAGIFSMNNLDDFWGNLDVYMEPYKLGTSPNPDTAFMKVHLFNDNAVWKGQFPDVKIPAAIGKWVHIAATYNATTSVYAFYANGLELGVNSAGNTNNTKSPKLRGNSPDNGDVFYGPIKFANATKLVFGTFQFQTNPSLTNNATAQGWAQSFTGTLDEFRIYDVALGAGDVSALFKLEALGR